MPHAAELAGADGCMSISLPSLLLTIPPYPALQALRFDVHARFSHLRASSISSRLQLAALHAATSTPLPEPGSQRATGAEIAMQLLRQCWTNQPLGKQDLQQLRSVAHLGGHLAPGLRLLAYDLELSAAQLAHYQKRDQAPELPALDPDAGIAYQQAAAKVLPGGWGLSRRQRLTAEEEQRVLGVGSTRRAGAATPAWRRLGHFGVINAGVPKLPGACQLCAQRRAAAEGAGGGAGKRAAEAAAAGQQEAQGCWQRQRPRQQLWRSRQQAAPGSSAVPARASRGRWRGCVAGC